MVLTRRAVGFWLLALGFSLLGFGGCVRKPGTVKLAQPAQVATAYVVAFPDRPDLEPMPELVVDATAAVLGRRNLQPVLVDFAKLAAEYERKRATEDRLELLAASSSTPFVMLVETRVRYYSLINGRYRWGVDLKVTIAPREQLSEAQTEEWELAAFLDYDHQDHVEALQYSAPQISERIGRLADQFLSGLDGAAVQRPVAKKSRPSKSLVPNDPLAPGNAIYFVMVDRFHNGDPANDQAVDPDDPQAFHGGDLQGVAQKLDWLNELGVGTIWLSPVFEMRDEKFHGHGAFHGYWVEDFGAIEDRFGGPEGLATLQAAAADRGMNLMLDVVLNHVSFDAPLVSERPNWFHNKGGITDWASREQVLTHDVHGLPDLAQENPQVYEHLLKHSLHWIDELRPAGFRLDAVKHVPNEFWVRYNADVRARAGPGFVLLGEDLDGNPANVARTMREGQFDAMFDFPLHFAMVDVFCRDAHPGRLASILYADRLYPDAVGERREGLVTLLDNHDLPRILSACGAETDRVVDAVKFMLTARGTPSITWGTESGALGAGEPDNRADMSFVDHPVGDALRTWLDLRKEHGVFTGGEDAIRKLDDDELVYVRNGADEAAMIVYDRDGEAAAPGAPWRELGEGGRVRVFVREGRAETPEAGTIEVEFVVKGAPGADVRIVGSGPELGDWDPAKAPRAGRVALPAGGAFAYKAVVLDGAAPVWQDGDNRYLLVTRVAEKVDVAWK